MSLSNLSKSSAWIFPLMVLALMVFLVGNPQSAYSQPVDETEQPAEEPEAADGEGETENTDGDGGEIEGGVDDAGTAEGDDKPTMLEWMITSSGPIFGPIFLILSFVMVSLIVMNFLQIRRDVLIPPDFVEQFEQKLNGKDYQGAYELAKEEDAVVSRVLAAGMGNMNRGYSEAIEGMQEVGEEESMDIEHKLSYLALIAAVAPMIGLMGTVYGMITSFRVIADSAVAPSPKLLSGGIAKALFTTLEGLMIAIPAMVAYTLLRNRSARVMLDIGIISGRLMNRFSVPTKGKSQSGTGASPSARKE